MQVVLVMFRADGQRRSFSISRDITVVGRREDCDLRIPLGDVSRKHCRFIRDEHAVHVEDLGSSNGTFHNGEKVTEGQQLHPGDTVQIGPVTFLVQIDGVPADDQLQAAAPGEAVNNMDFSDTDHAGPDDASANQNSDKPVENIDDLVDFDMEEKASPEEPGT
jgi:pSer/pThr/pTyr-binding forkhead associated (FHA) protein